MSNSADDQLFDWVKTRLDAISEITDITGGDGIVRDDWSRDNIINTPRLEYNPYRFSITEGGDLYSGQFGITIVADRSDNASFGGGTLINEGNLWTLEAEVIASLSNTIPSLDFYKSTSIEWTARRRPTLTPEAIIGRRLNFSVNLNTTGFIPLSGNGATISGLPGNLSVQWWNIAVEGPISDRFTGESDDVRQILVDRQIARVNIGVRVEDNDGSVPITLYPASGSTHALTFGVHSGVSFVDPVLFSSTQFTTRRTSNSTPLMAVLRGTISNSSSPVFGGVVT